MDLAKDASVVLDAHFRAHPCTPEELNDAREGRVADAKPSPEPVFLAMRNLDSNAAESLFVGDSETDVSAARNANISVVCMRDGYNHGIDVSSLDCDGVIVSMSELL